MSRNWEDQLSTWIRPASQAEEQRRDSTVREITNAINAVPEIADYPIKVCPKGSFDNNTNVRLDSDVDVNVEYTGIMYFEFTHDLEGMTADQAGIEPATTEYEPEKLKADIQGALEKAWGAGAVTGGNKAIALRERRNQLAADVVPCFTWQRYYKRGAHGELAFHQGTVIFPDRGVPIENWPKQHHDNGVAKNRATDRRFKGLVRILKNLENEMVEQGAAAEVPSYLIECLVYNVPGPPDPHFGHARLVDDLRAVLAYLWNNTRTAAECHEFVEVNELKWLFRGPQKWTWQEAHAFVDAAWNYVSFE